MKKRTVIFIVAIVLTLAVGTVVTVFSVVKSKLDKGAQALSAAKDAVRVECLMTQRRSGYLVASKQADYVKADDGYSVTEYTKSMSEDPFSEDTFTTSDVDIIYADELPYCILHTFDGTNRFLTCYKDVTTTDSGGYTTLTFAVNASDAAELFGISEEYFGESESLSNVSVSVTYEGEKAVMYILSFGLGGDDFLIEVNFTY